MGLFDFLDPGKEQREAGVAQAEEAVIEGTGVTGPGGISAGTQFADGQATTQLGLGSFAPFLSALQGLGQQGIGQAGQGFDEFAQQSDFAGLGDIFQGALGTATADPFDLGADVSNRLRELSARRNDRNINRQLSRLQASGTADSVSGIFQKSETAQNLREQGLKFDLAGLQAGQSLQKDAFGRALGAVGGRGNIFQNFLANQRQGADIGFGGVASAAGLSQLPLAFLAGGGAEASRLSNSLFGASQSNLNAAEMAKSPFLEALNAAGGIASSIAPGGFLGKD